MKIAKLGEKLRNIRLRWYGHVKRREESYVGKTMMEMAVPDRRRREGHGEDAWIWQEKTWKALELWSETKLIGSNGKYFRAVATPNREKRKKEEEILMANINGKAHY